MNTRSLAKYGTPDSPPEIVRVRGVNSDPDQWRRLQFTDGIGYGVTLDAMTIYDPTSITPLAVSIGQEYWVIWNPEANRYEIFQAGGDTGDVIYALVNGAVGPGDPTGLFDTAQAIVGDTVTGSTGTFQNQYAQTYGDNDPVLLFYNKVTGQWLTERGGESGSQVVYFELTQNMAYADTAKLAKPVQDDGTLDAGASAFYVVDDRAIAGDGQYYGKAAYTDGDTEAASHDGYRGHAVRFIDDWNSTGVPGFRIVDMEGPGDFILVVLKEDVAADVAECDVVASNDPAGGPDADRKPRIEATTYHIVVNDDLEIAANAKDGETWVAKWDRGAAYYIFWRKVLSGFHVIKGTSPGVVRADTSFTLGSPVAVQGTLPSGTITVYCDPKIVCPNGQTVYARYDVTKGSADTSHWSTADAGNDEWILKGYPQYDASKKQIVTHDAGTAEWNEIVEVLTWLTGYGSAAQSIGKDVSDTPEWQDDGTACP